MAETTLSRSLQSSLRRGITPRTEMMAHEAANMKFTPWTQWAETCRTYGAVPPAHPIEQFAMATSAIWNHLPPHIRPGELIVGARLRAPQDAPELGGWVPDGDAYVVEYAKMVPPDRADLKAMATRSLISPMTAHCHRIADYEALINTGCEGIIQRAEELAKGRSGEEMLFTQAYIAVHKSIMQLAANYADEASRMADIEEDAQRAAELREIASICRKVPAKPAGSFREALQSYWFFYHTSSWDMGRHDQLFIDFYRKDLAEGRITPEEAQELIECLLIKAHRDHSEADSNVSSIHTLTLGGLLSDGSDACNELTMLYLKAIRNVRLSRPTVYVRLNTTTPDEIINFAVQMLAEGLSEPNFYGDMPIIKGLERVGIPTEQARGYALGGCTEVVSPGKSNWGSPNGWINLALLVDDVIRETAAEGEPSEQTLWLKMQQHIDIVADAVRDTTVWMDETSPLDLGFSMFMPCCLEKGMDLTKGGAVNYMAQYAAIGLPNAADMLYSWSTLVYKQHESPGDIISRLDSGDEAFRKQLKAMPKFGQGEPEVDHLAAKLVKMLSEALEARSTPLRKAITLGHLSGGQNMHIDYGRYMGNTLDGRRSGDTLADSLAGSQGFANRGVTNTLRSLYTLDHSHLQGGNVSTIWLAPADARTVDARANIVALIKAYVAMGGSQLQINFMDSETLKLAQAHPEEYHGLMIRIAGYSADFTNIGKTLQDEVISRLEGLK